MKKPNLLKNLVASSLLCGYIAGGVLPAMAATDGERLAQYETVVFGQENTKLSTDKRLQALEKSLFGKASSGASAARLDAIGKLVQGKSSSEYLPALPPMLDRSQFMKEPQTPPQRRETAAAPQYDEAPPPADSSERVNGMLREAMKLYSAGRLVDAERIYQSVLAIDFRNPDANFNLGAIAEDRGDLKAAQGFYRTANKANPDDDEVRDALASVEQKLRSGQAAKVAEAQAPKNEPANDPALKGIAAQAAADYKKGDFDAAISKLNFLSKRSPYDANVQFALGQAWRGKGNSNEALKHLRAASTLNPKNDLYASAVNQVQADADKRGGSGGSGGPLQYQPDQLTASNDDGKQAGEITPFTGAVEDAARNPSGFGGGMGGGFPGVGALSGMDIADVAATLLRGRRYGGVPLNGSVDAYNGGYGYPMGGMGMGGMGFGGLPTGLGFSGATGGTRVRRAVQAGVAGAAMGAMSNRGRPGGMSQGAMKGALYGGLYGLMTGGGF